MLCLCLTAELSLGQLAYTSLFMNAEAEEVPERWPHIGAGASHLNSIVHPQGHTRLYMSVSWRGTVGVMKIEPRAAHSRWKVVVFPLPASQSHLRIYRFSLLPPADTLNFLKNLGFGQLDFTYT